MVISVPLKQNCFNIKFILLSIGSTINNIHIIIDKNKINNYQLKFQSKTI